MWSLRDQIEEIVLSRLHNNPNDKNFDDLVKEFSSKKKPNLRLLKFEEKKDETSDQNAEAKAVDESTESQEDSSDVETEPLDQSESVPGPSEEAHPEEKEIIFQRLPSLPVEKVCKGKTFLSEIYMDQMLFFSDRQYTEGQSIVIQFNVPERFILNAEVTYCQPFSLKNRIISASNLPYRVCAVFTFLKTGERTLLRRFLENVEYRPESFDQQEEDQEASAGETEALNPDVPTEEDLLQEKAPETKANNDTDSDESSTEEAPEDK